MTKEQHKKIKIAKTKKAVTTNISVKLSSTSSTTVGASEMNSEGDFVGVNVRAKVGDLVFGDEVGSWVGGSVSDLVGDIVGEPVDGFNVGDFVGFSVGSNEHDFSQIEFVEKVRKY